MEYLQTAKCNRQKSFYNRAYVERQGNEIVLYSYSTKIVGFNYETGEMAVYWKGYSKTTLEHINAFFETYLNFKEPFNKKSWMEFADFSAEDCYRVTISNGFSTRTTPALYGDYASAENAVNNLKLGNHAFAFID